MAGPADLLGVVEAVVIRMPSADGKCGVLLL